MLLNSYFSKKKMKDIIITLDYELRWGMDIIYGDSSNKFSSHIKNTPAVIKEMISLFNKYEIKSTWASVVAISLDSWDEYYEVLKEYNIDPLRNHFGHTLKFHNIENYKDNYFSKDSFNSIINSENAEIGSHSFRHIYFGENSYQKEDFILDNKICSDILENKFNIKKYCYVFPRNQIVYKNFLDKHTISGYREIPSTYGYKNTTSATNNKKLVRASRTVNDIFPLTTKPSKKYNFFSIGDVHIRFNLPEILWKTQLLKIKLMLQNKSSDNCSLHLWWHPHNVSISPIKNLQRLEQLLMLLEKNINNRRARSSFMSEVI